MSNTAGDKPLHEQNRAEFLAGLYGNAHRRGRFALAAAAACIAVALVLALAGHPLPALALTVIGAGFGTRAALIASDIRTFDRASDRP